MAWREVGGEIVALDLTESRYLAISKTGSAVWAALERGATRSELLEAVTARFEVTPEVARHDLERFVSELLRRGVLAEEPPE